MTSPLRTPPATTWLLLSLLAVPLAGRSAAAEGGYKPCSILTPAEVEASLGVKPSAPNEADAPYKKGNVHDHDGVLSSCSWTAPERTLLLAVSSAAVTPEGKAKGKKAKKDSEAALEKQGIQVERKAWGTLECTFIRPPKGKPIPHGTTCSGEKGKSVYFLSVSSKPDQTPIPMEKLKALAEKAAARLP